MNGGNSVKRPAYDSGVVHPCACATPARLRYPSFDRVTSPSSLEDSPSYRINDSTGCDVCLSVVSPRRGNPIASIFSFGGGHEPNSEGGDFLSNMYNSPLINNRQGKVGRHCVSIDKHQTRLHLNGLKKPPVLQRRMHEDEKKTETVSGSSSTQVLTYMRVACTDTHVMWARLLGDTVRPCGVTSQR
ncbi:hypothetical protein DMN91_002374 [Ooceraea biroi]|uniref:Uncharacterized protein n=1 Tax=Ooceraea biroi TaxID=2015173 RepID=A0A3L8DVD7_OOCBI|nr:uncharacterized protein LOC105286443 isoform X1 [Ooceraea biroi]RLU24286.1 hypothetical protein DMN91_002374 [Ooceraea biroi]